MQNPVIRKLSAVTLRKMPGEKWSSLSGLTETSQKVSQRMKGKKPKASQSQQAKAETARALQCKSGAALRTRLRRCPARGPNREPKERRDAANARNPGPVHEVDASQGRRGSQQRKQSVEKRPKPNQRQAALGHLTCASRPRYQGKHVGTRHLRQRLCPLRQPPAT